MTHGLVAASSYWTVRSWQCKLVAPYGFKVEVGLGLDVSHDSNLGRSFLEDLSCFWIANDYFR